MKDPLGDYLDSVFVISKSKYTVRGYRTALTGTNHGLRKFIKERYRCADLELIQRVKNGELNVYKVLNDFVIYLNKSGIAPTTIVLAFTVAKGYLSHLGAEIYTEKCKQFIRLPKRHKTREEPLTKEIINRLLHNLSQKLRTIVLIAAASGLRIGEIAELKVSDIDFDSKPTRIKVRAETTKTRESRETFLTLEATKALKDYLSRYLVWNENGPNTPLRNVKIFGRNQETIRQPNPAVNEQSASTDLLEKALRYQTKNIPELNELGENGRKVIHFHALRKFFYTTVSDICGRNYAEGLMGHHFYMDTYWTMTLEKRREKYLKAEPYLTISDFAKIEKDLKRVPELQEREHELRAIIKQIQLDVADLKANSKKA